MFCKSKLLKTNDIPLPVPSTLTRADIVYPKQNPLYIIKPKTIGIPYYCCAKKP